MHTVGSSPRTCAGQWIRKKTCEEKPVPTESMLAAVPPIGWSATIPRASAIVIRDMHSFDVSTLLRRNAFGTFGMSCRNIAGEAAERAIDPGGAKYIIAGWRFGGRRWLPGVTWRGLNTERIRLRSSASKSIPVST